MNTVTYQQPKRDTFTTCPVCGEIFKQDGIGRMRKYCSDACKMKAHRRVVARKPWMGFPLRMAATHYSGTKR